MKIANPIYDVVFKYLMDDNKIAKLIISKIIGEEVETLDLKPTEMKTKIEGSSFTVFRIDFSALICHPDGSKRLVIIEVQKAKLPTDIMRFRKYLGHHYQDKNNSYTDDTTGKIKALPIISLYFLGHRLEHNDAPVIQVKRKYIDLAENKELPHKEVFIESLTHDSYVIQIPALRKNRRTNLEILLSIFDQRYKTLESDHYLDLKKGDYPEEFQLVIKRLLKAGAEVNVCRVMDLEDEILNELEAIERSSLKAVERVQAEVEKEKAGKEEAQAEAEREKEGKEKAQAEAEREKVGKEEAQAEAEKAQAEAEKAQAEAEKAQAEKEKALHHAMNVLTKTGISSKEAAEMLGISMDSKK